MSVKRIGQPVNAALALASLSPLVLLYQLKSALGLDGLHLGLVQLVIIFCVRMVMGGEAPQPVAPEVVPVAVVPAEKGSQRVGRKARRRAAAPVSRYTPQLLDSTLWNLLSITEPSYLHLLPDLPRNPLIPTSAPLSSWTSLLSTPNLSVLQHPSTKSLYAISATYADVTLRQLFETLTQVEKRLEWDGMCAGSESLEEVLVGNRKGSVSWLGMKGVAVVKAKDMVLLSVVGQLPPSKTEPDELRLFAATTSIEHEKKPVDRAYNRMTLNVSGFIAEAVGENGSKVTQITDLSGLGSWVPSAVVRTVTQTMIPKSLVKLGRTAAAHVPIAGADWLPPMLGSSDDTVVAAVEEDEEGSEDEEDEEVAGTGLITEDVASLLSQLRVLTHRLASLQSPLSPVAAPLTGSTRVGAAKGWGTETMVATLSANSMGLIASVGGAVGAATVVGILAAWGRGKR